MPNLFTLEFFAYLAGCIGIIAEWRAYYLHCGLAFRQWSATAALLWAVQYCLLGAWTAGLTMACTAIRTLLSEFLEIQHYRNWAALGFVLLFGSLTLLSWQGTVSLIPTFAVINTTLALFYLNNKNMRIALLASSIAWIANDIYWLAWPGLLAEVIVIMINLRTIRKLTAD